MLCEFVSDLDRTCGSTIVRDFGLSYSEYSSNLYARLQRGIVYLQLVRILDEMTSAECWVKINFKPNRVKYRTKYEISPVNVPT